MVSVREIAPGSRNSNHTWLHQLFEHQLIIHRRIDGVAVHIEIVLASGMLQSTTAGIAAGMLVLRIIRNA